MRGYIRAALVAAAAAVTLGVSARTAVSPAKGLKAESFGMERSGQFFVVDLGLDLKALKVGGNRAKLITPVLVNGRDSLVLGNVGIYGRRRYYYYERNYPGIMIAGQGERSYRSSHRPDTVGYHTVLPFADWMNGAKLVVLTREYGCCRSLVAQAADTLTQWRQYTFQPQWVFVRPQAQGPKRRVLSGSAYIDFPVDQTVIYPTYRRNAAELGKIQASIDSVRGDSDVTITSVWLKGYASPESPYAHNTELSLGRVAAVKKYIQDLYSFTPGMIVTENEPEDWEGLRRWVEASDLPHRREILDIIDCGLEPDPKEWRLKSRYPEEYRILLDNVYPALRHTDYRIDYNVRDYNDLGEIRHTFATAPSKLSLGELFMLAGSYPEGSREWDDLFETAARMYPSDPTANLNAATAAMEHGNLEQASRYLDKAGTSTPATYARGVLAALRGEYATARPLLQLAAQKGLPQAADAMQQIDLLMANGSRGGLVK